MSLYIKPVTMRDVLLNNKYKMDGHYFYEEDINKLVDHWHETTQAENLYEFIGRNILGIEHDPNIETDVITFHKKCV